MIALCSLQDLKAAGRQMEELQHSSPELFAHLRHVVHLTKQMEFRCSYLGRILRNQETDGGTEIHPSVLRLYHGEVHALKRREDAAQVTQWFEQFHHIDDWSLCQLIIGERPESLKM
ncbi:hypothetical protein [Salibacterium sp. K-3]